MKLDVTMIQESKQAGWEYQFTNLVKQGRWHCDNVEY